MRLITMMVMCNKLMVIRLCGYLQKVKQHWSYVGKKSVAYKKSVYSKTCRVDMSRLPINIAIVSVGETYLEH